MKTSLIGLTLALSAGSLPAAGELQPGASLEEVHATLGMPKGRMQVGGRQILYYERGAVELEGGALTRVALRSPEEHAILTAREERLTDEREARRARLFAEGTAERDRKLADASFQAAPLAYQVAYWEDFSRRYPEVSCTEPLAVARLRYNEQLADKRRRDEESSRLAEIEERIAAAERHRVYYPVRGYMSGYGRHRYRSAGLGPFSYTFFDTPLPPYSTPSGNPAGDLRGPLVSFPATIPVFPTYNGGNDRSHRDHGNRGDHLDRPDAGSRRWRERM